MFGGSHFWLETRVIIKFRPILDIQEPLTDFHGNETIFFWKKKNPKWPTQKKTVIFKIAQSIVGCSSRDTSPRDLYIMTLSAPYKNSVLGIFTEECDSDTNLTDASFNERVRQETLLKRKTCNSHDYFPFCQFLKKRVWIIDMYLHTYKLDTIQDFLIA